MSWADAKSALKIALEGLVAEIPDGDDGDTVDRTVQTVFKAPPASIEPGNLPCIIFGQSELEDEWNSSLAIERYTLVCSLLLRDEDGPRAVEWAEAFREAVKVRIRHHLDLLTPESDAAAAGIFAGPSFTAVQDIAYARQSFPGFQFTVAIQIDDADPGFAGNSD